jgi:hypothetical protein
MEYSETDVHQKPKRLDTNATEPHGALKVEDGAAELT